MQTIKIFFRSNLKEILFLIIISLIVIGMFGYKEISLLRDNSVNKSTISVKIDKVVKLMTDLSNSNDSSKAVSLIDPRKKVEFDYKNNKYSLEELTYIVENLNGLITGADFRIFNLNEFTKAKGSDVRNGKYFTKYRKIYPKTDIKNDDVYITFASKVQMNLTNKKQQ